VTDISLPTEEHLIEDTAIFKDIMLKEKSDVDVTVLSYGGRSQITEFHYVDLDEEEEEEEGE